MPRGWLGRDRGTLVSQTKPRMDCQAVRLWDVRGVGCQCYFLLGKNANSVRFSSSPGPQLDCFLEEAHPAGGRGKVRWVLCDFIGLSIMCVCGGGSTSESESVHLCFYECYVYIFISEKDVFLQIWVKGTVCVHTSARAISLLFLSVTPFGHSQALSFRP